jgi:PAS domain S-box-containing protein
VGSLHTSGRVLSKPQPISETAALLAAIVESSDDVIVSKTLDGTITSWNPAAERTFGYTAAEAVGQNIRLIIPPDRWAEEDDVLAKIGRGERVDHFETIRRAKDGHLINVSLVISPVKDQSGKIVGASKVARDITERKTIERERERLLALERESRERAEEASRLKDEFLAVVSHELRSPLNAIMGWASLLRTKQLDDQTMRAIETIQRNANTQNQLIGDLLDVSRIVSGQLRLNIRPFELVAVINAAIEVIRPSADAKSIRIQTQLDPSAGPVTGDPDRLQQVFWNLLSNAVKFTPIGGRIQIRLQRANSHAELTVSDTGKGIGPKLLPYVFERFRQGDSSTTREYGGLGLGLAIVRHLVELHGGVVHAHSEGEGKGAQFVVELPVSLMTQRSASSDRTAASSAGEGLAGTMPVLDGLRILFVDDERDAREIVTAIFRETGAEVATASNVEEALHLLESFKPNVLISDIGMPAEDGYSLIRRVRSLPADRGGTIPAIALTAFARTQERLKVLSAGFQMHVPKPLQPLELAIVVASLTGRL